MGKNIQTIADGISREDWELIEKTTSQIADHPQPPLTEKIRIMAFVGMDASKFKGYVLKRASSKTRKHIIPVSAIIITPGVPNHPRARSPGATS